MIFISQVQFSLLRRPLGDNSAVLVYELPLSGAEVIRSAYSCIRQDAV